MLKFKIYYLMKVLAFGDSFVKMFLHCEPQVKHWKFKGKSVKGLVKEDDFQRRKIEKQIRKAPNGTKILLFFGQVDFNYVRYYKVIKGQPPITQQTFKKYVEWVASMNYKKNISIVSIFPTPIKKEYIVSSLLSKGSYTTQQQTSAIDQKILAQYDKSHQTWEIWNSWINTHCVKNRVNNIRLFEKDHLQPEFYDVSNLTIHLRYVPVLKLVKKHINISFDAEKAEQIQKIYEKEKVDRISNSVIKISTKKEEQNISCNCKQADKNSVTEATAETIDVQGQSSNQQGKALSKQGDALTEMNGSQQFSTEEVEILKTQRKHTADLDTDTNNEGQLSRAQQAKNIRSNSNQPVQQSKKGKKKNRKKTKNEKEKEKEKKKLAVKQKLQDSSDGQNEGQRFLQLSIKCGRKY